MGGGIQRGPAVRVKIIRTMGKLAWDHGIPRCLANHEWCHALRKPGGISQQKGIPERSAAFGSGEKSTGPSQKTIQKEEFVSGSKMVVAQRRNDWSLDRSI